MTEVKDQFSCFGSTCAAFVIGDVPGRSARAAVAQARSFLLDWHERFTRFEADSELSRLNADARRVVPVSDAMARFAEAVVVAGRQTGGLVDGTLLREIEAAGYREDLGVSVPLALALELAPPRRPAGPSPREGWNQIAVDRAGRTITRPVGVALDSGGLAKGLAADLLAAALGTHECFAINAAGDVRVGGAGRIPRPVRVASPFDGATLHTLCADRSGRRHQRDRPAQLAGPRRRTGAPPARSSHRQAGVHGRRPGHGDCANRARGRDAREGGGAERARRCGGLAAGRWRPRFRGRRSSGGGAPAPRPRRSDSSQPCSAFRMPRKAQPAKNTTSAPVARRPARR